MRIKPWVRWVHLILALLAALPLLILAVTGALLVFPETTREVATGQSHRSDPSTGPLLPPSRLLTAAGTALPEGDRVTRVQYPNSPEGLLYAQSEGGKLVSLDPYTGEVRQVTDRSADVRYWLTELHVSLFAGKAGTWVTGLSSLALLLLSFTGLYLWWPRGGWRWHYFRVAFRHGRPRLLYDLHRVVGFYACVPLVLIAATGTVLAFWATVTPAVYWATGSPKPARSPRSVAVSADGRPMLGHDRIAEIALEHAPGTGLYRLYPPAKPGQVYRVFVVPADDRETRFRESRLVIDPFTGKVLHDEGPATMSAGDRALRWVLPLHYGTFAGRATRLLWVVASLTPVLLSVTGIMIWTRRRAKKRRAAAGREAGSRSDCVEVEA